MAGSVSVAVASISAGSTFVHAIRRPPTAAAPTRLGHSTCLGRECRDHARLSHKSRPLGTRTTTGRGARQAGDRLALLRGGSRLAMRAVGDAHNEVPSPQTYATASRESGSTPCEGLRGIERDDHRRVGVERRPDAHRLVSFEARDRVPHLGTDERFQVFESRLIECLEDDVVLALTQR
jgi:hypothetical protein